MVQRILPMGYSFLVHLGDLCSEDARTECQGSDEASKTPGEERSEIQTPVRTNAPPAI